MLRIYSIKDSHRLHYISKILFEAILGIEHEIVIVANNFDASDTDSSGNAALAYGIPIKGMVSIPNSGLLFEEDIRHHDISLENNEIPKLFFNGQQIEGYSIDFDLLSSAFYLITQYENYLSSFFDSHERYDEHSSIFQRHGLHQKPVLDIYAAYLWEQLKSKYPDIKRKIPEFDYQVTFDIDAPYLYRHKGFMFSLASVLKNILQLRLSSVNQQIKALSGGKDPYDVYDLITDKVPAGKLLLFFLINRKSPHDGRHTFKNKAYRKLIKKLSEKGIETGIHPSYTSFMDSDLIQSEKSELESITGKTVTSSRMHFLKFRLPETFEYLNDAGINEDYTLCPVHDVGFKSFISRPYHWFNLERNEETSLMLHPTMVMDRSLQLYMHLSPEEALDKIKSIINTTYKHSGVFTILFHNNSLSETSEWKGWKMVFENTMMYLSTKKATN